MKDRNNRDVASALKRLGNYECENQMSIFDVDWDSIQKSPCVAEKPHEDFVLEM